MDINQYQTTAKIMAFVSFIIGTIIFGLHFIIPQDPVIMMIGLFYVILAAVANFMMLLVLIGLAFIKMDAIDKIAQSILILLSNLPIAMIYFMVVVHA